MMINEDASGLLSQFGCTGFGIFHQVRIVDIYLDSCNVKIAFIFQYFMVVIIV